MIQLDVPVLSMLEEAIGYTGAGQWVVFYAMDRRKVGFILLLVAMWFLGACYMFFGLRYTSKQFEQHQQQKRKRRR